MNTPLLYSFNDLRDQSLDWKATRPEMDLLAWDDDLPLIYLPVGKRGYHSLVLCMGFAEGEQMPHELSKRIAKLRGMNNYVALFKKPLNVLHVIDWYLGV